MVEQRSGVVVEMTVTCPQCRCVIEFRRVAMRYLSSAQVAAVAASASAYCPECKWQANEDWFATVTADLIEERISLGTTGDDAPACLAIHDCCKGLLPPA